MAAPPRARCSATLAGLCGTQVCNHPALCYQGEPFATGEAILGHCGKLLVLDRLLVKLKAAGHRWGVGTACPLCCVCACMRHAPASPACLLGCCCSAP